MQNKNIDAVQFKSSQPKRVIVPVISRPVKKVLVDDIRRLKKPTKKPVSPKTIRQTIVVGQARPMVRGPLFNAALYRRLVLPLTVFIAIVAFMGGMAVALRTPKSIAEEVVIPPTPAGMAANFGSAPTSTTGTTMSNETLFNTPLELLQSYFQNSSSEATLTERKTQIQKFLAERNSPLKDDAELIAEQPHWKLILAISFAESTLGKNCYEFNCSGIGGSQIRTYKSFANWILDFNRLLDKRYNDWTLEQMCGVYVKPCTKNWLNATGQILDELQQNGIN